jgi:hypothetical protein
MADPLAGAAEAPGMPRIAIPARVNPAQMVVRIVVSWGAFRL